MSLRADLEASVAMDDRRKRYEAEVAALVSLARYQSKLAVRAKHNGRQDEAKKYRSDSWWHFGKAHQKRVLSQSLSHLRIVA